MHRQKTILLSLGVNFLKNVRVPINQLNFSHSDSGGEYLFVVGDGGGGHCGPFCNKTEIVSLSNEPIPDCLKSLADHPNGVYDNVWGALLGKQ